MSTSPRTRIGLDQGVDEVGQVGLELKGKPGKSQETARRAAGLMPRPVTFHRYGGTGHWFFEHDRAQAYDPEAASLAWERTLAFLNRS